MILNHAGYAVDRRPGSAGLHVTVTHVTPRPDGRMPTREDHEATARVLLGGHAHRSHGIPGVVVRVDPRFPGETRIDVRTGLAIGDGEALDVARRVLSNLDRPAVLRQAGALRSGLHLHRPGTRRSGWRRRVVDPADVASLLPARDGANPGILCLGIEPPPSDQPAAHVKRRAVLVTRACAETLADVVSTRPVPGHDGLAEIVAARRPPAAVPPGGRLLDAAIPPWVAAIPLSGLARSGHLRRMATLGCATVADVADFPLGELPAGAPFARGWVEGLRGEVDDLAVSHAHLRPAVVVPEVPVAVVGVVDAVTPEGGARDPLATSLLPSFEAGMAGLDPDGRIALGIAHGLADGAGGPGEAASALGITRARAALLRDRATARLVAAWPWAGALGERLADMAADAPFPLDRVSGEPWAAGLGEARIVFLLRALPGHGLHVLGGDPAIVTTMPAKEWQAALKVARRALRESSPTLARHEAVALVCAALPGLPEAGRSAVAAHLLPPGLPEPARVPTHRATSAILEAADGPLTFDEAVAAHARTFGYEPILTVFRAELGRQSVTDAQGRYRLPRVDVDVPGVARLLDDCLDRMAEAGEERHWSTAEIVEALTRRHLATLSRLGAPGLEEALSRDARFRGLKGGFWILASAPWPRAPYDAWAEAILAEADGPMPADALMSLVHERRGPAGSPQLREHGGMVRVAPGVWGLLERDLGVGPKRAGMIGRHAVAVLRKGGALPVADLLEAVRARVDVPDAVGPSALAGILALQGAAHVDAFGTVAIDAVRPPRAGSLRAAILEAIPRGASVEGVVRDVRERTGRTPSYAYVRRLAEDLGRRLGR